MAPFLPVGSVRFGPAYDSKAGLWPWPPPHAPHLASTPPPIVAVYANPIDGLRDHSRSLASLHANPHASTLRRARHFHRAELWSWGDAPEAAHDYLLAFQESLWSVR